MDDQLEPNIARSAPEIDAVSEAAPAADTRAAQPYPYVRRRPAHRNVGTVSDYDDAGEITSANTTHDSGYTNRGSLMSGDSYRRSRADAQKLRRNLHYGQYLEIPKGRRDIFVKHERVARIKAFLAIVVVVAILALAFRFMSSYIQIN